MVHWLITVMIGVALGSFGAFVAIYLSNTPNDSNYAPIGSGIGLVGVGIVILGIITKVKYGLK